MIEVRRSKELLESIWEKKSASEIIEYNRHRVYVYKDESDDYDDVRIWCDENLQGLYYHDDDTFLFELESDMIAFKAYWHGKEE